MGSIHIKCTFKQTKFSEIINWPYSENQFYFALENLVHLLFLPIIPSLQTPLLPLPLPLHPPKKKNNHKTTTTKKPDRMDWKYLFLKSNKILQRKKKTKSITSHPHFQYVKWTSLLAVLKPSESPHELLQCPSCQSTH